MTQSQNDSDSPEVILARAEAYERRMKARSELHPVAQVAETLMDRAQSCMNDLGCLIIILIVVIALLAPQLFGKVF